MNKLGAMSALLLALSASPVASEGTTKDVVTKEIRYKVGDKEFVGLLAYDAALKAPVPGILVVHEWQGINSYAKKRAVDLAHEGYVALAVDMYGDGKEVPVSEARTVSSAVGGDFPLIRARFDAALAELKKQPQVDTKKLAAIGYCFGGGIVLNMARLGTDLAAVVSFHGTVNTGLTAQKGDIKTRILAIQGDGDPATPVARREALVQEMDGAGADFQLIVYPGVAAHNFTNPAGPTYYEKEATLAWNSMRAYLGKAFAN